MKKILFFFCMFTIAEIGVCAQETYLPLKIAFHVHTNFSYKGQHSIEEISVISKKNGLDAVIISDDAVKQWEWGVQPWQNLIKKKVKLPSVFDIGVARYISEIRRVNLIPNGCLIIPGLEVAPHYCWMGAPVHDKWSLCNAHKHMVVFGLNNEKDWEKIPVIHNKHAYGFGLKSILLLWPAVFMLVSLKYMFDNKRSLRKTAYLVFFFIVHVFCELFSV